MNQGPRGQQHPQRSPLAWSCRRSLWSALLPNFLRLCLRGGRVPPTAGAREGGRGGRGWRSFPARWDLPSLWLFRGPFRGNAPDVRFDFRWPLPGGMGLRPSLSRVFGDMLVPFSRVLGTIPAACGCIWGAKGLFLQGLGAQWGGTFAFVSTLLPSLSYGLPSPFRSQRRFGGSLASYAGLASM